MKKLTILLPLITLSLSGCNMMGAPFTPYYDGNDNEYSSDETHYIDSDVIQEAHPHYRHHDCHHHRHHHHRYHHHHRHHQYEEHDQHDQNDQNNQNENENNQQESQSQENN